jgi:hypothetical protein
MTQSDTEIAAERLRAALAGRFEPLRPTTGQHDAELRIAHALEYIATQIGEINHKLDRLVPEKLSSDIQDIDGGGF